MIWIFINRSPDNIGLVIIGVNLIFLLRVGFHISSALLWRLSGKEEIALSGNNLRIRRQMVGFKKLKDYQGNLISNLEIVPWMNNLQKKLPVSYREKSTISFNYKGESIKFGYNLDESDANQIIQLIISTFDIKNTSAG